MVTQDRYPVPFFSKHPHGFVKALSGHKGVKPDHGDIGRIRCCRLKLLLFASIFKGHGIAKDKILLT